MITALDHINVRTSRLAEMTVWYDEVLGMKSGFRPDFPFGGAWLYIGDHPAIHLVEVDKEPGSDPEDCKLEHGAFRAEGYRPLLDKLEARGETFRVSKVPKLPIVQVNIWDPDGNHLHVDFHADETEYADGREDEYPGDPSQRPGS